MPDVQDVPRARGRASSRSDSLAPMLPIRVAVDTLGGDRAPDEIVAGALEARSDAVRPVLFGPSSIDPGGARARRNDTGHRDAREAGGGRSRQAGQLARGRVPVGRAAETRRPSSRRGTPARCSPRRCWRFGGCRGVMRPAIAVVIPSVRGPSVLIDAGANAESRPEHLLQFATMGAIFAEEILEIARARGRPALDRRGGREGRPGDAGGARHARRERPEFVGNVESRWLLEGAADVVVTDGFTGNVSLKLLEGTILSVFDGLRAEIERTPRGKLGGSADQAGRQADPRPARSGGARRRVLARVARSRRHRARQLLACGDRERDPAGGARRRARRRGETRRATWQEARGDRVSILAPAESDG